MGLKQNKSSFYELTQVSSSDSRSIAEYNYRRTVSAEVR
jgi:hypothetical protein